MNRDSVTEYYLFLNEQIIMQEKLLEYHLKTEALFKVLLESNLSRYSYSVLHHYLWGINDNIVRAKHLNETLLDTLIKIAALMEPKGSGGNTKH